MTTVERGPAGACTSAAALGEALEGLLEFTGATAGWVGLRGADGRLSFPARRGEVPDAWLALQQAPDGAWGFAVCGGPTLLNDLRPLPPLGAPPLRNLLSCPLGPEPAAGQVVLANKPTGFTSADGAVLQGACHLMFKCLARPEAPALPAGLGRALDRAAEGALVLDEGGALLFANAAWLDWTGFAADELVGRPPPYPFWVSHRDLAAGAEPVRLDEGALPFRRRDGSLLWCRMEAAREEWQGRPLTLVFLQPAADAPPVSAEARADWLALWLRPGAAVELWGAGWERLTGLSAADLAGAPGEMLLDWLFPAQRDRERLADWLAAPGRPGGQAVLEVLTPTGSRPMLCTLLPVASSAGPDRGGCLLLSGAPAAGPGPEAPAAGPEAVRAHPAAGPAGPHAKPEWSQARRNE
jgi:PAS domain S-box-containing protein